LCLDDLELGQQKLIFTWAQQVLFWGHQSRAKESQEQEGVQYSKFPVFARDKRLFLLFV
jgi:hypothetical protein